MSPSAPREDHSSQRAPSCVRRGGRGSLSPAAQSHCGLWSDQEQRSSCSGQLPGVLFPQQEPRDCMGKGTLL